MNQAAPKRNVSVEVEDDCWITIGDSRGDDELREFSSTTGVREAEVVEFEVCDDSVENEEFNDCGTIWIFVSTWLYLL
jgi:hypothetical protein